MLKSGLVARAAAVRMGGTVRGGSDNVGDAARMFKTVGWEWRRLAGVNVRFCLLDGVIRVPALAEVSTIVIDCANPAELAEFYARMTGWKVTESGKDYASVAGEGTVALAFQRLAGYQAPAWPEGGAQLHLDMTVPDLDAAVKEFVAAGAGQPEFQPGEGGWVVLTDPEGHPFCIMGR